MSGVALFGLKYSSLLQFDISSRNDKIVKHNLSTLYDISKIPSDTYMRQHLDEVEAELLQKSLNKIISFKFTSDLPLNYTNIAVLIF